MTATYTAAELKEFDKLTERLSSPHQMTRHNARFEVLRFEREHGTEKCQAMFAELKKRDARKGHK